MMKIEEKRVNTTVQTQKVRAYCFNGIRFDSILLQKDVISFINSNQFHDKSIKSIRTKYNKQNGFTVRMNQSIQYILA
jgi:hypothetical protein